MKLEDDHELERLRAATVDGMRSFMNDANVGYTEDHIQTCDRLLKELLTGLSQAKDASTALESVRKTVQSLNSLNATCEHDLIETDQREDICAFIIRAGALAGFNVADEDVTAEWREW